MKNTKDSIITVVIPLYNAEEYVESFFEGYNVAQNIDFIIVNDASTDDSLKIWSNFVERNNIRAEIIDVKENMGAANARNVGLSKVKSPYVLFLDADDIPVWPSFPILYETISENNDFDIVYFKYALFQSIEELKPPHGHDNRFYKAHANKIIETPKKSKDLLKTVAFPWNKLYRTNFVKQHLLEFSHFKVHNDLGFVWKANLLAEKAYVLTETLYLHREHAPSNINSITQISDEKRLQIFDVFTDVDNFILELSEQDKVSLGAWDDFKRDLLFWCKGKLDKKLRNKFYRKYIRYEKGLEEPLSSFRIKKRLFKKKEIFRYSLGF